MYPNNISDTSMKEQESSDNEDLDFSDERIDYSNALLKENKNSKEILSKLNDDNGVALDFNKVQTGFVKEKLNQDQFNKMDSKTQNQFIFDVLPSFGMYHAFQYVSPRGSMENPDEHDSPPDYFNQRVDQNCTSSCMSSTMETSSLTTTPGANSLSLRSAQSSSIDQLDFDQDAERNIIDKAHTLPHIDHPGLSITMHVTKDIPDPSKTTTKESILKEYTSGDVVHGYVIIHNTTNKPIQFQMFHVTLEGYTSVIDKQNKKQYTKRFLSMLDLSASWSYGCVSPSANFSFEPLSKDPDGCILGLRNDRILAPNTKHKKFFTFKFPYNLLDNACHHQQEIHTLLPPSFGVDILRKKGKYSQIQINPALNYGHLGTRGSPILTNDLSQNNTVSISYGINAKLIGVIPSNPSKLVVLKEDEYCLRFIPFGFTVPLFSSKKNLISLCDNIEHGFKMVERALKLNIEGKIDEVEQFDAELKNRQLSTCSDGAYNDTKLFPLRNKRVDQSRIESQLSYFNDENKSNFILNRFKSKSTASQKNSSNSNGSGLVLVSTNYTKDGLPYKSPSMIRKTNELSNLSEIGLKNFDTLSSSLSSNEKQKYTLMKLNFRFLPSDKCKDLSPPEIRFIKPTLLVFNIFSNSSIPIKLSSDLVSTQKDVASLKTKFENYHNTYLNLQTKLKDYGLEMNNYLDPSLIRDINAMKDLQVEKFRTPIFDHSIDESSQWEFKNNNGNNEWEKTVDLSLSFKERFPETLIPNFQSCLLSRVYCINVDVVFKNGQKCELAVPIRVRKFDDF